MSRNQYGVDEKYLLSLNSEWASYMTPGYPILPYYVLTSNLNT